MLIGTLRLVAVEDLGVLVQLERMSSEVRLLRYFGAARLYSKPNSTFFWGLL